MDLVSGVRKEGSRGGRGEFKWSDVQSSQHRESYLGHSVMAPVGRWQKGRDLQWYAKDDASASGSAAESARQRRHEEIQQIKKAEEEALSKALGYTINLGQSQEAPAAATGSNSLAIGDNRKTQYDVGEETVDNRERRRRREPNPRPDHRSRRSSRERRYRDRRRDPRGDREHHSQPDRDQIRESRSHMRHKSRHRSRSPLPSRSSR